MNLIALGWAHYAFMIPLALISVFLTLVILVQRGRGGGLTGALGGMGGASAFGTKAGDLFTKVTIAVAFVWVVLAMASLKFLNVSPFDTTARGTATQPQSSGKTGTGSATSKPPASGSSTTTPPASGTPAKGATGTPAKSSGGTSSPAPAPSGDAGAKPAKPAEAIP